MTDPRTNIAISAHIHHQIKLESARRGITVFDACTEALVDWLPKSKRKPAKVIQKTSPALVTQLLHTHTKTQTAEITQVKS